ncbi:MAG TPA: LLM class flavin-dependent oxidoreductase [Candidatus Binatia bacterium]|nr:LLM class flavin-dependent oxidoreductase [Candidatus Binatia bacterium]
MKIGVQMLFQNPGTMSDAELYARELKVAELAEPLGFDTLWSVEHHYDDYSMCPDNMQFLSWLAGRTSRIGLGTAAVILPWNNPLRVVEKMVMLDHFSGGRSVFGMGRGLAKMEYRGMMIDMNEARERFDESARMILAGLESGFVEGKGPFYKQDRTEVRPRPMKSFKGRTYCVAMSPESVPLAAELEAVMMVFSQFSPETLKPTFETYRNRYRECHRRAAPPPLFVDFMYCDEDAGRAEEKSRKNIAAYLMSVFKHYEMFADHFGKARGYEAYAKSSEMMKAAGLEKTLEIYVEAQAWGTPQQILDRLEKRRGILGDFEMNICPSFSELTFDEIERSTRLFAKKVMPELRARDAARAESRAEVAAVAGS